MSVETFPAMVGLVMKSVDGAVGADVMRFVANTGDEFIFDHSQSCCERVQIEDVVGDIADLVGHPIIEAEQISSDGTPAPPNADSYTWTFYRFSTVRGTVTVRWLGESNGYYGEEVSFTHRRASEAAS